MANQITYFEFRNELVQVKAEAELTCHKMLQILVESMHSVLHDDQKKLVVQNLRTRAFTFGHPLPEDNEVKS